MRVEAHVLTHDDEQMLGWSLRHYAAFCDRIVVHDGGPKGVDMNPLRGDSVEVRKWDTAGQLNDELALKLKNECWRGTDADWVIVADADELVCSPSGLPATRAVLSRALRAGAAVLRPRGFEMFSEAWIDPVDWPIGQIAEIAPDGAPDDEWYAKPIVFSPRLVADSGFGIGAHESRPVLRDGRVLVCDRAFPFADPPLALLHYKSIFGGLERIAARYDATRKRLAEVNVRQGWGNLKPGAEHAREKRERLLPRVRRVVGAPPVVA